MLTTATNAFTTALATGDPVRPLALTVNASYGGDRTKITILNPIAPPRRLYTR